jgi:hypothetical protein
MVPYILRIFGLIPQLEVFHNTHILRSGPQQGPGAHITESYVYPAKSNVHKPSAVNVVLTVWVTP